MPVWWEPPGRNATRRCFRISLRAKLLQVLVGEMAASDWLGPSGKPDRPLLWNARVTIVNGYPLVEYPGGTAGFILWPDGTTDEI